MVIGAYVIVFSGCLAKVPLSIAVIRMMIVGILRVGFILSGLYGMTMDSIVMMITLMFVMMSVTIPIIAI